MGAKGEKIERAQLPLSAPPLFFPMIIFLKKKTREGGLLKKRGLCFIVGGWMVSGS